MTLFDSGEGQVNHGVTGNTELPATSKGWDFILVSRAKITGRKILLAAQETRHMRGSSLESKVDRKTFEVGSARGVSFRLTTNPVANN